MEKIELLRNVLVNIKSVSGRQQEYRTEYVIDVNFLDSHWIVYRSYSEFKKLKKSLMKKIKAEFNNSKGFLKIIHNLPFPRKHSYLASKSNRTIDARQKMLNQFLIAMMEMLPTFLTNTVETESSSLKQSFSVLEVYSIIQQFLMINCYNTFAVNKNNLRARQDLTQINNSTLSQFAFGKKINGSTYEDLQTELYTEFKTLGFSYLQTLMFLETMLRVKKKAMVDAEGPYSVDNNGIINLNKAAYFEEVNKISSASTKLLIREMFFCEKTRDWKLPHVLMKMLNSN